MLGKARVLLLSAAEEVFGEQGFHRTSISSICRRAGVARATFYQHFVDKEALYSALVEQLQDELLSYLAQAFSSSSDPKEKVVRGLREHLEFICLRRQAYRVFREGEFILPEVSRRFYRALLAQWAEPLEGGMRAGVFRPDLDAEICAVAILGIVEFLAMRYLIWEAEGLPERMLAKMAEFLLYGMDSGTPRPPAPQALPGVWEEERVPENSRGSLLQAAEALFGTQGYYATQVVHITQTAGLGTGTFYLYFPTKEAAFVELVRTINQKLRQYIRQAILGVSDRRWIEELGFRAFFSFITCHPHAYRIVREAEFVVPEVGQEYYRRFASGYIRGLAEGMQRGEIRELPPEPLAYSLMGMGHALGLKWVLWEGRRVPPEEGLQALFALIFRGLAAG
jgi:AcrR family transcriptional regulator